MALKWGILSTGKMAYDFVIALQTMPSSDHEIVAVAARSKEDAEKFAQKHGIPRAYGGYVKLAQDEDIEIVYVGNQIPQHFETIQMLLENGKNVVSEKPMALTKKQTEHLVDLARKNKLFLMEGNQTRFSPLYLEMRRIIESGAIGDVLFTSVTFGQNLDHVLRVQHKESGGGAIFDLGVYSLAFQQLVFKNLKPLKVVSAGHLKSTGVDETSSVIVTYPGGKMAVVSCSNRFALPNEALVVGSKGTLKVPNFFCPTQLITPEETLEFPLPECKETFIHTSTLLTYEAEEVKECLRQGKLESSLMTLDESIQLAELIDLMRKEAGYILPEDLQELSI